MALIDGRDLAEVERASDSDQVVPVAGPFRGSSPGLEAPVSDPNRAEVVLHEPTHRLRASVLGNPHGGKLPEVPGVLQVGARRGGESDPVGERAVAADAKQPTHAPLRSPVVDVELLLRHPMGGEAADLASAPALSSEGFVLLAGEQVVPVGQARNLIRKMGVVHTHHSMPSSFALHHANLMYAESMWETVRMAQADLVAALRAHKAADAQLRKARTELEEAIRQGVLSGEWKIVDVVELTDWSRETIRKIVYPKA
jgi:hypothetical protein